MALEEARANLQSISDLVSFRIDNATHLGQLDRDKWRMHVNLANRAWSSYLDAECYTDRFAYRDEGGDAEVACKTIGIEARIQELMDRYELHQLWRGSTFAFAITEPLNIAGFDREPMFAPMPDYRGSRKGASEDQHMDWYSDGSIERQEVIHQGDPELEETAVKALRRWMFARLPEEAPRQLQEGLVIFRFGE